MAEDDLAYLLEQQSQLSVGYYDSELANDQLEAQRYYKGDPFGNEQEGRSRVVSRDVATTVDSVMPDLIKLFLSILSASFSKVMLNSIVSSNKNEF